MKHNIIIIGAGLSGLFLANCLTKFKINFIILESKTFKDSVGGSHITLFPNSLKVLEQLGLYDKIKEYGTYLNKVYFYNYKKFIGKKNLMTKKNNYDVIVIKREDFMKILLNNINNNLIYYNKKLKKIEQKNKYTKIYCLDNSEYETDILIGCDGAWSTVRKEMHRIMKENKVNIPKQDKIGLKSSYIAITGTTKPFPEIFNEECSYTVSYKNKIATYFLQKDKTLGILFGHKIKNNKQEKILKWNNISKDDIIKEFGNEFTPFKKNNKDNYNFGELIEKCDFITKVNLEEKNFEKWYYKNIVLVGDSVHKMLPWAGQGGNQAIEDCIYLVNNLIKDNFNNVENVFKIYNDFRRNRSLEAVNNSNISTKVLSCDNFLWYIVYLVTIKYFYDYIKKPWETMIDYQPILNLKE